MKTSLDKSQSNSLQFLVDQIADETGLHSVLFMESLPETMRVVCANQSQDIYHKDDEGPKSTVTGEHEQYCERVVSTGRELFVADAAADDEWKENDDLIDFGLGVYLGLPIKEDGRVIGTICALHNAPFDFETGSTSAKDYLFQLQAVVEQYLQQ